MSDSQRASSRITSLGGIKPSRMPASVTPDIPVAEAEARLGITHSREAGDVQPTAPAAGPSGAGESTSGRTQATTQPTTQETRQSSQHESNTASLPASLLTRRPKPVTVSRTFRLPLALANKLEQISAIHEIPMVTILAEALEIHLARFPREKTSASPDSGER